ncbi:hypothetical protein QCA50_003531 [Cerrena zonata]|uniref:Uncharacterized protein n=1 Tax=Cerrena zonata TaxID=2478898 RepID=A0AAW0GMG7_9APHY
MIPINSAPDSIVINGIRTVLIQPMSSAPYRLQYLFQMSGTDAPRCLSGSAHFPDSTGPCLLEALPELPTRPIALQRQRKRRPEVPDIA